MTNTKLNQKGLKPSGSRTGPLSLFIGLLLACMVAGQAWGDDKATASRIERENRIRNQTASEHEQEIIQILFDITTRLPQERIIRAMSYTKEGAVQNYVAIRVIDSFFIPPDPIDDMSHYECKVCGEEFYCGSIHPYTVPRLLYQDEWEMRRNHIVYEHLPELLETLREYKDNQ